jgi:hypothetical protein
VGLCAVADSSPIEGRRLRIRIDKQDMLSLVGKVRSEIRGDRALAGTTFLVHHTNNHNNLHPERFKKNFKDLILYLKRGGNLSVL